MSTIIITTAPNLGTYREYSRIPEDYVIPNIHAIYDSASGYVGGDIFYEVVSGVFPTELILGRESGIFSGIINEMDDYVPNFKRVEGYTPSNYATTGSASLFYGYNGIPYVAYFVVRAYDSTNPAVYEEKQFYLIIQNDWSSDRDDFILKIPEQSFVLDGKVVTNEEYLLGMKLKGYFNN